MGNGPVFKLKLTKELIQKWIIYFSAIGLFGYFSGEGVVFFLYGAVIATALSILISRSEETAKKERELTAKLVKAPPVMNHVLMLILSGLHPRNALIEAFEPLKQVTYWDEAVCRLVGDLSMGVTVEGAILSFNADFNYRPVSQMLMRISLYERTGNEILLKQLQDDVVALGEQQTKHLEEQISRADLASMLPSLIHLLILMVLLMAPLLMGGTL